MAFPVRDISETKEWYSSIIGCEFGRESKRWIDINFFGHQISAHLSDSEFQCTNTNNVDGDDVPIRHFGIVLEWSEWNKLSDKLKSKGIQFVIEPHTRFSGRRGEQATMFISDPSGNVLEFKSFRYPDQLFESDRESY